MPRKTAEAKQTEHQALTTITTAQQRFIELLLSGKSITEAARVLRLGRRTLTYWLEGDTQVRAVYEQERQRAATEFRERLVKLHDQALTVLEETLSSEENPGLRFAAARFLYQTSIAPHAAITPLSSADEMVSTMIAQAGNSQLHNLLSESMGDISDIPDD